LEKENEKALKLEEVACTSIISVKAGKKKSTVIVRGGGEVNCGFGEK